MRPLPLLIAALATLLVRARADNSTLLSAEADTCDLSPGPWSSLLEQWALDAPEHNDRHGRIMALPPAQGYYVTDRVDRPPPPPYRPQPPSGPIPYAEWQQGPPPPPDTKIVNRPPYKDKFKPSPSYNSPPASQQIPAHQPPPPPTPWPAAVDRVGEPARPSPPPPPPPPRKQVSETDLYLLSAIEKLVWRVDFMEKRLRKMEESMHYLVVGNDKQPDACVSNFTRLGEACYHYSGEAADWKSANLQCRKLRSNLLELDSEAERRVVLAAMLADTRLRGTDVWTGGLNPGLLWIWSHSARPVAGGTSGGAGGTPEGANATLTVVGDGRCLALVHDPALNTYVYRGQDCALRHRFICEKEEDKTTLSNEIDRRARALAAPASRGAKIAWAGGQH